ncbi:hypothetical protein AB6A40_006351 [Gnathostoma spinigerum]|uniref:Transcription factor 25 n=1 Tax=Gnathostoma spinigerum TaxID=75299 RepID=A0ABD6ESY0_9BILA
MSTKQLRKLIEKNERNEKKEESDESGDDSVPNPDINRFSLLEGEPDEEDDEKSDENVSGHVLPVVPPKSKSAKKLKKRNKKKMKKTDVEIADGVIAQTSEVIPDTANDRKMLIFERDFFRIDTRALDADEELRRLIGSRLSATSSSNRHRKHLIPGRIIKRKPFWPEVKAAGISMVFDHSENGIDWFRFIHHGHYRVAQQSYWEAAESMDQSLIAAILQAYPYHLDSLLVMAEYLRMQEDFQQARDLIERGIFCCESALAPRFQLTNYDHRIDYNDFENRAFFLLLNRYLRDSVKRCCFTTAFNVAKLVFSLDPVNDPLAVLLVIDSIAIRAHQYSFLIDMFENLKFSRNLERLPNFAFSVPLAYYMRSLENNSEEDRDKADSLIAVAIRHYPTLLIQLLDKMNVKPDDKVENNPYMSSLAHNR